VRGAGAGELRGASTRGGSLRGVGASERGGGAMIARGDSDLGSERGGSMRGDSVRGDSVRGVGRASSPGAGRVTPRESLLFVSRPRVGVSKRG
jgi:hypothetical protein